MQKLNTQRFILALSSVAGLLAAGVGIFLAMSWGKELTAVAVGLLTLLIREIGGGKAMAFSWFFDGAADKPPPEPGTSTTTASAVVEPVKASAIAGATPTGKPDDPIATKEVPPAA